MILVESLFPCQSHSSLLALKYQHLKKKKKQTNLLQPR